MLNKTKYLRENDPCTLTCSVFRSHFVAEN